MTYTIKMWLSLDKTPPAGSVAEDWFKIRFPDYMREYWSEFKEEAESLEELQEVLDKKINLEYLFWFIVDFKDPSPDVRACRDADWQNLGGGEHEGRDDDMTNKEAPWGILVDHVRYSMQINIDIKWEE